MSPDRLSDREPPQRGGLITSLVQYVVCIAILTGACWLIYATYNGMPHAKAQLLVTRILIVALILFAISIIISFINMRRREFIMSEYGVGFAGATFVLGTFITWPEIKEVLLVHSPTNTNISAGADIIINCNGYPARMVIPQTAPWHATALAHLEKHINDKIAAVVKVGREPVNWPMAMIALAIAAVLLAALVWALRGRFIPAIMLLLIFQWFGLPLLGNAFSRKIFLGEDFIGLLPYFVLFLEPKLLWEQIASVDIYSASATTAGIAKIVIRGSQPLKHSYASVLGSRFRHGQITVPGNVPGLQQVLEALQLHVPDRVHQNE
jgi:hypothetical protein